MCIYFTFHTHPWQLVRSVFPDASCEDPPPASPHYVYWKYQKKNMWKFVSLFAQLLNT